jgi:hypothetical protein
MPFPSSKQQFIKVQGKVKWSQLVTLDPQYHNWHISIYPTPDSLNTIRDLQGEGLKNVIKKDDENQYFVKFTRYPYKEYKDRGGRLTRIDFAPPEIIDRDGVPYRDLIGAGSDVTLKLEVYQHAVPGTTNKAKAARLAGIMIDNLVPYSRADFGPAQESMVKGLDDTVPLPNW